MNDQSSFRAVAPDPQAIARHLELMFGYLEGYVPLRLLSELGTPSKPLATPSTRPVTKDT